MAEENFIFDDLKPLSPNQQQQSPSLGGVPQDDFNFDSLGKVTTPVSKDDTATQVGRIMGTLDTMEQYDTYTPDSRLSDDEKDFLRNRAHVWSEQDIKDAENVFLLDRADDNFKKEKGFEWKSNIGYYFDPKDGKPKHYNIDDVGKLPKDLMIARHGNFNPGEDTWITDLGKSLFNSVIELPGVLTNIADYAVTGVTGKEENWAKDFKQVMDVTIQQMKAVRDPRFEDEVLDSKAFTSVDAFFDGVQDVDGLAFGGFVNQLAGSLLQFYLLGLPGRSVAATMTKPLRIARALGISTAISTQEAGQYFEDNEDLSPREKVMFSALTAVGIGALELMGGIEADMLQVTAKSGARYAMAEGMAEATKKMITKEAGEKLTQSTVRKAFKNGMAKAAESYTKSIGKESLKKAGEEAKEEFLQSAFGNVMSSYSTVYTGEKGLGEAAEELYSPDALQEYFLGTLGGGLMGFVGGGFGEGLSKERNTAQNITIGQYVADGKSKELEAYLKVLKDDKSIDNKQYEIVREKIETFKEYHNALGENENLSKQRKAELYHNTFTLSEVEQEIDRIENDNSIRKELKTGLLTIQEEKKKTLESNIKKLVNNETPDSPVLEASTKYKKQADLLIKQWQTDPNLMGEKAKKLADDKKKAEAERKLKEEPKKEEPKVTKTEAPKKPIIPEGDERVGEVKEDLKGKLVYATPASGKTTMVSKAKNTVDMDDILVEELGKTDYEGNPRNETIGSQMKEYFDQVRSKDGNVKKADAVYEAALERGKKLAEEGYTVFTGSERFIKDADVVFKAKGKQAQQRLSDKTGDAKRAAKIQAAEEVSQAEDIREIPEGEFIESQVLTEPVEAPKKKEVKKDLSKLSDEEVLSKVSSTEEFANAVEELQKRGYSGPSDAIAGDMEKVNDFYDKEIKAKQRAEKVEEKKKEVKEEKKEEPKPKSEIEEKEKPKKKKRKAKKLAAEKKAEEALKKIAKVNEDKLKRKAEEREKAKERDDKNKELDKKLKDIEKRKADRGDSGKAFTGVPINPEGMEDAFETGWIYMQKGFLKLQDWLSKMKESWGDALTDLELKRLYREINMEKSKELKEIKKDLAEKLQKSAKLAKGVKGKDTSSENDLEEDPEDVNTQNDFEASSEEKALKLGSKLNYMFAHNEYMGQTESVRAMYNLVRMDEFDESDILGSLKKIAKGELSPTQLMAQHLSGEVTYPTQKTGEEGETIVEDETRKLQEDELISLVAHFQSLVGRTSYAVTMGRGGRLMMNAENTLTTIGQKIRSVIQSKNSNEIRTQLNGYRKAQLQEANKVKDLYKAIKKSKDKAQVKRFKKKFKEAKEKIVQNDLKLLHFMTGENFRNYLNSYRRGYDTYEEAFENETYKDGKTGQEVPATYTPLGAYIIQANVLPSTGSIKERAKHQRAAARELGIYKDMNEWTEAEKKRITLKAFNFNEKVRRNLFDFNQISTFVFGEGVQQEVDLNFFDVKGDNVQSYGYRSLLDHVGENILDLKHHAGNLIYDTYKKLDKGISLVKIGGINTSPGDGQTASDMFQKDREVSEVVGFLQSFMDKGLEMYYQNIGQLGDKKPMVMYAAPKMKLDQVKKEYKKLPAAAKKNNGIKEAIKYYTDLITDLTTEKEVELDNGSTIKVSYLKAADLGDISKLAETFVYNNFVNTYHSDEIFFGHDSSGDKGFGSFVNKTKRAGSFMSSGISPVIGLVDGLQKTFTQIVVNDFKMPKVEGIDMKKPFEWTDGMMIVTQEFAKKANISFGKVFDFNDSFKWIYVDVTENGEQVMNKTHAIVLTDELIEAIPEFQQIADIMSEANSETLIYESAAKAHDGASELEYGKDGSVKAKKLVTKERQSVNLRVQQDMREDPRLKEKSLGVQIVSHLLQLDGDLSIRDIFNQVAEIRREELIEDVYGLSSDELATFLADRLNNNPSNLETLKMLEEGVGVNYPEFALLADNLLSAVMKGSSKLKGNGTRLTTFASPTPTITVNNKKITLRGPRVENGKTMPGQVVVSEDTGLRVGDKGFFTRIPTGDLSSANYSEVVAVIPNASNTVIMDPYSRYLAGEDLDADQRYLWTKYYAKKGKGVEVEKFNGFWTRKEVESQYDKVFLFGDNTNDRTNTKYVPSSTQAVIRGLPNAIGIDTKKNRGTSEDSFFTNDDFDQFKKQVDSAIREAKKRKKTIVIPADGIGTGKAMLFEKAPKLFEYLENSLEKLSKNKGLTEKQNLMNDAFDKAVEHYENPDNFNKLTRAIGTAIERLDLEKSEPLNPYNPLSRNKMFKANREGKKVIGIAAKNLSVFNYLVSLGSGLVESIGVPRISKGKVEVESLSELQNNDEVRETIADILSEAVDNAKNQLLDVLGITIETASTAVNLATMGLSLEEIKNYLNTPIIQDYMKRKSDAQSETSMEDPNEVFQNMAEELIPGSTKYNETINGTLFHKNAKVTPASDNFEGERSKQKDFAILQNFFHIQKTFIDTIEFGKLIDSMDKPPKTYAEFYRAKKALKKISTKSKYDTNGWQESKVFETAYKNLELKESMYDKYFIYGTGFFKSIVERVEDLWSTKTRKGENNSWILTDKQTEIIQAAAYQMLADEYFADEQSKAELNKWFKDNLGDLQEKYSFFEAFQLEEKEEVRKGVTKLVNQVKVKPEYRGVVDAEVVQDFQERFKAIDDYALKQKLALIQHRNYRLSAYNGNLGGFGAFIDPQFKAEMSSLMEQNMQENWRQQEISDKQFDNFLRKNVNLIPLAKYDKEKIVDGKVIPKLNNFNYVSTPSHIKFVPKDGKVKVFKTVKYGQATVIDAKSAIPLSKFKSENYGYSNESQAEEGDSDAIDVDKQEKNVDHERSLYADENFLEAAMKWLRETYPDIKLTRSKEKFLEFAREHVGPDKKVNDFNALGAAFANTVFIDPLKAVQSTIFHEVAHIYWDALPENDATKKELIKQHGSEEAAVQAIGLTSVDIIKESLPGLSIAKIKKALRQFWRGVKNAFGVKSGEDYTRKMASRMVFRKDQISPNLSEDLIVKYMTNTRKKVTPEREKANKEKFIAAIQVQKGFEHVTKLEDLQEFGKSKKGKAKLLKAIGRVLQEFVVTDEMKESLGAVTPSSLTNLLTISDTVKSEREGMTEEEKKTYKNPISKEELDRVTNVIGNIFEFRKDEVAEGMARRNLGFAPYEKLTSDQMEQLEEEMDNIKEKWDFQSQSGTIIHEVFEWVGNKLSLTKPNRAQLKKMMTELNMNRTEALNFYDSVRQRMLSMMEGDDRKQFKTEVVLLDDALNIGGTSDIIQVVDAKNKKVVIWDVKTKERGKTETLDNEYSKPKGAYEKFRGSANMRYSTQTAIYQKMLERQGYEVVGRYVIPVESDFSKNNDGDWTATNPEIGENIDLNEGYRADGLEVAEMALSERLKGVDTAKNETYKQMYGKEYPTQFVSEDEWLNEYKPGVKMTTMSMDDPKRLSLLERYKTAEIEWNTKIENLWTMFVSEEDFLDEDKVNKAYADAQLLDKVASEHIRTVLSAMKFKARLVSDLLEETKVGTNKPQAAINFVGETLNMDDYPDWVADGAEIFHLNMTTPSATPDAITQYRQSIIADGYFRGEVEVAGMENQMEKAFTKLKDVFGSDTSRKIIANALESYDKVVTRKKDSADELPASAPPIAHIVRRTKTKDSTKLGMPYIIQARESLPQFKKLRKIAEGKGQRAKEAQAVIEFLKAYKDNVAKMTTSRMDMAVFSDRDRRSVLGYKIPKVDAPFLETIMRSFKELGLVAGSEMIIKRFVLGTNTMYDDYVLNGDQFDLDETLEKGTTFGQAKEYYTNLFEEKIIGRLEYRKKIRRLQNKIEAKMKKQTIASDADGGIISFESKSGNNLGVKFGAKGDFDTENDFATIKRMFHNGLMKENVEMLRPTLFFIRHYLGKNGKLGLESFLQMHDDSMLDKKQKESKLGLLNNLIQGAVNYTAWRYLAINPKAAVFNALIGVQQSFVHNGLFATGLGIWRLVSTLRPDVTHGLKSLDNAFVAGKGIEMMRKLGFVTTSQNVELNVTKEHIGRISNVVFSTITIPEYVNASYTILGLMTHEEFNSYDENFNVIPGREATALTSERKDFLLDQLRRINGAYHPLNKRGVNLSPVGRALMQFKNWFPDFVSAHFDKAYVDRFGIEQGGIYRTSIGHIKDVVSLTTQGKGSEAAERFRNLSDIEKRNYQKLMRELMLIGMWALVYASMADDDDKKEWVARALKDMAVAFDPDAYLQVGGSIPALTTLEDFYKLNQTMFQTVTGQKAAKYKRSTDYARKGDLKVGIQIIDFLPGRKMTKPLMKRKK